MSTRQLQDRLEEAAQALPDPTMASLDEVRERANSRRRRRWTLTAAASLSAVVLMGVAGMNLLPQGPDSPVIGPVGQAPQAIELADDAVWKSPPVADATTAAEVFTELFLGWDDPTIELSTNDETGPVFITIVPREDEGRQVRALFTPTPAAGVWQVVQVGDGFGTSGPDPRVVSLDPPVPFDSDSADLFVRYAGQTWHVTLDGDELRSGPVDLAAYGLPPEGQRNSGLIIYRDASGETLTAAGGHAGTGDRPSEPSRDPDRTEGPADGDVWVDDDAKEAWDAENGPGTWVAGYFLPQNFPYDSFDEGQLVRRWLRTATGDRDLDRAALLAASLAALPDAAPAGAENSWQPYPGSAERRLDLAAVHLDDDEVVLDFSELEATAPGTAAAMAMGLQFDTIVTHYYPEAASVCVLVDGEPSSWLHDMMTCPSRA